MGAMTDYLEEQLLNHVFRSSYYSPPLAVYLALFTSDPTDDGVEGTEVSGGSYARQSITFAAASSPAGTISNSATVTFSNTPACTVTHAAIYDAVTGGHALMVTALPSARVVTAGENLSIAAGDLTAVFD